MYGIGNLSIRSRDLEKGCPKYVFTLATVSPVAATNRGSNSLQTPYWQ